MPPLGVSAEVACELLNRADRLPFISREKTVPVSVRLPLSLLEWMDDVVAHRDDPAVTSRSDLIRDALDIFFILWKARGTNIGNDRGAQRWEMQKFVSLQEEREEFGEHARRMADRACKTNDESDVKRIYAMVIARAQIETSRVALIQLAKIAKDLVDSGLT